MRDRYGALTVVEQTLLAKDSYQLVLQGETVAQMTQPGQFLHVRVGHSEDLLLRRPISIADVDVNKQQVTMIYRASGEGTSRLSHYENGKTLNVMGPLGKGFPVEEAQTGDVALLVGGGIGVPPLYYLAKQLVKKGVRVISVLGFASKQDVFYEEAFKALGDVYVTTVDGSHGVHGFVTNAIDECELKCDVLYACGPTPMLKVMSERYRNQKAFISLEERMGCGIGACFACVCAVEDGDAHEYRKICSDGPVFPVGEVVL
ncbi:dihydroorotate dehydrogenase electron transfer subunit [Alkalihalobacillus sp. LMS6]|uniref:dihydroorotate dehydrogenase electron transfer subunit n=1 Tax=Alkalihalobacillus sp. LMS6 TaxID=2924034 RepID=UPI0020D1CAD7|nr:dihydroorotate dehydrogenase electron transfer subunit [Alkalihalobacillus sp. LMS6]UTR04829.1 dihydroorotate dehydrogenase electron transfer subunit [Alkalihalobacillus sp. LMS6]